MKASEAKILVDAINRLIDEERAATPTVPDVGNGKRQPLPKTLQPTEQVDEVAPVTPAEFETLYQRVKNRFIDEARIDPILLQLIMARPEIAVEIEPRVVTLDGATTKGRVARLMAQGWFSEPRTGGAVRAELKRTGADPGGGGSLYDVLNAYVRDVFLVRVSEAFQLAPGVRVTDRELKAV